MEAWKRCGKIFLFGCAVCGIVAYGAEYIQKKPEMIHMEETEKQNSVVKDSVNLPRENINRGIQADETYIYTFLTGQFCRIERETLERTVLYESSNKWEENHFWLEGEYIYLLDIPGTDWIKGRGSAKLYRIRKDGTEVILLKEGLDQYSYRIEIYDGILYLTEENRNNNRYFRIQQDGSLGEEVGQEETIYADIPEEYREISFWNGRTNRITFPSCMRTYGYIFFKDYQNAVWRAWLPEKEEEQRKEELFSGEWSFICLTEESIVYGNNETNMEKNLSTLITEEKKNTVKKQFLCLEGEHYFWDYNNIDTIATVWRQGKEGELEIIWKEDRIEYDNIQFLDVLDDQLYYITENYKTNKKILNRQGIESGVQENIGCITPDNTYYLDEIGSRKQIESEAGNAWIIQLKEHTEADRKINEQLKRLEEKEEHIFDQELQMNIYQKYTISCQYADENYLCVNWYCYGNAEGAAHPYNIWKYYIFDRRTGEQLTIQDLVKDTEEEIKNKVWEYFSQAEGKANYEEDYGLETVKQYIWDGIKEWNIYITEEGIGIWYNQYEIASYSYGAQTVEIPYSEFQQNK